jgi:AcrR family transcriptional regulator
VGQDGVVPSSTRKAEQSERTRRALLDAARALFAQRGYAATAMENVVRAAGVTRGALYHQFEDKRDLFRAVYEELEEGMAEQVAAAAAAEPKPERHLEVGVGAFLDACLQPAQRRISLLEAPSVLGYEEWRGIGARFSFGLLRTALEAAMEAGRIERRPVDSLAHLILGALAEAALLLARADDHEAARAEIGDALNRLLDGLGPRPTR